MFTFLGIYEIELSTCYVECLLSSLSCQVFISFIQDV